ncbi:protein kinase [Podospora australis]|uniref:Protein kinase n=1 Tax=Podospora australis TaxID=1536484 RepID=A0AAN6X120_9PEZI|nr:protein kinase [Podospora australis]
MWWDDQTIERTVTRPFVCSHLIPEEIERLDRPLGFGDGLTDGTYWEWIEEKAKKIFLILVDLEMPDQIFGIIDDSWDDEDLPIAQDQVERLALTQSRDEKVEAAFYERQFHYLLQPLKKGNHVVYKDPDVVPLDILDRKHVAGQSPYDKVALPSQPGMVFGRLRMPLGPSTMNHEDFLLEVNGIKNVQNDHLASYWASYIHQGVGYVLFTRAADYSLKSFITTTPTCFKNMDKKDRRRQVMNWIHCLIDSVCFLHNRGLSHGNIKPSTIMFTNDNQVFFADLLRGTVEKGSFDKESYDYAAPEQWFKPASPSSPTFHRRATVTSPATVSPEKNSNTYTLSRSATAKPVSNHPMAMMHAPTPHLSPQAADIFSLGCVILDLLSFLLKKHGRPFATHRAARHKTPSRGGAVPDSSFHKNLGQVESWMTSLAKDAAKKEKDDPLFGGFVPMLHVVEHMLTLHPSERPSIHHVQAKTYKIITESCGISEPHCVHQYGGGGSGGLKLLLGTSPVDDRSDAISILTHKRNSGGASGLRSGRSSIGSRGSTSSTVRRTLSGSSAEAGRQSHYQQYQQQQQQSRSVKSELTSGLQSLRDININSGNQCRPPSANTDSNP